MAGVKGRSGGRNKKATNLLLLQGTWRSDRHGDHETPDVAPGIPDPPEMLTPKAKREWARMVDRLATTGALSKVDDGALYQYCELFSETEAIKADNLQTRKLSIALKKEIGRLEGEDLVAAIQEIVKLRFVLAKETQQLRQGHMALRQYLVEFGLTPSARTRVKLPPKKAEVDPRKERFFGAGSSARA